MKWARTVGQYDRAVSGTHISSVGLNESVKTIVDNIGLPPSSPVPGICVRITFKNFLG